MLDTTVQCNSLSSLKYKTSFKYIDTNSVSTESSKEFKKYSGYVWGCAISAISVFVELQIAIQTRSLCH